MPDDLVTRERIEEARRRYGVEFRGLRCPTDRCPGSVIIRGVRLRSDPEYPLDSYPALPLVGRVLVRYRFECEYQCQICECWGSYYVPVKAPTMQDDGAMITYAIQARGPQYLDDSDY